MIDFQAFTDEFIKIALARWQKELARGAITLKDLGAHSVEQARANFASAPMLEGAALDRMRKLAPLKTKAQAAFFNKVPRMSVRLEPGMSSAGSASPGLLGLRINVGDNSGTGLRNHLATAINGGRSSGFDPIPADGVSRFGVFRHELGEAKELMRSNRPAWHATHAGITPLLEERMAVQGDPIANTVFEGIRHLDPEDELAGEALKRVGGVGGHLVQPGTRRARALEKYMAQKALHPKGVPGFIRGTFDTVATHLPKPSYLGPTM